MIRVVRIAGWTLFVISLLAGLYGVLGGAEADNYPWLAVCIIGWIASQFVLALGRRLANARMRDNEDEES